MRNVNITIDRMTMEPETDLAKVRFGLITPKGEVYTCGYTGHGTLAWELANQLHAVEVKADRDHHGCVHISDFEFDYIERAQKGSEFHKSALQVTQQQLDVMFDYAIVHDIPFQIDQLEVV